VSHAHPAAGPGRRRPVQAGIFASAPAGLGDAIAVTELQLGGPDAPPPRTEPERALREYMGDPAGGRNPLLDPPNVVITPHIGGATHEALRRGAEMAARGGGPAGGRPGVPDHLVNPEINPHKEAAS
jgi:hypothetical protein